VLPFWWWTPRHWTGGSTLNNPHIPASYFSGWEHIEDDHAARLRELVADALLRRG